MFNSATIISTNFFQSISYTLIGNAYLKQRSSNASNDIVQLGPAVDDMSLSFPYPQKPTEQYLLGFYLFQ